MFPTVRPHRESRSVRRAGAIVGSLTIVSGSPLAPPPPRDLLAERGEVGAGGGLEERFDELVDIEATQFGSHVLWLNPESGHKDNDDSFFGRVALALAAGLLRRFFDDLSQQRRDDIDHGFNSCVCVSATGVARGTRPDPGRWRRARRNPRGGYRRSPSIR